MTEEENKAIDLLKFYEGFFKNIGHEEEVKSIESIINYIEKLQKEIEEEKKAFEWLDHIIDVSYSEQSMEQVLNNKNVIFYYIEKLRKELEELKKDNAHQWEERCKLTFEIDENYIPKDKIREKIENYKNEIECEKSYLEQGIICEEEYKDRVKVYNSYIFILNKLLEEE